jgi:neutral ceramidase
MYRCGLYESDITPALGMEMPGHFRLRHAKKVLEPLYCHAAYFEKNGAGALIISNDTIIVPADIAQAARKEISSRLNIGEDSILICATHTHTGGPVEDWGDFVHINDDYMRFWLSRIIDTACLAADNAREVRLSYGSGTEDRISYYRDFVMSDGSYRTNPGSGDAGKRPYGAIDPEVGVLRIDNADGTPYGAMVNFSCHCDCAGGVESYSADYPGAMSDSLKKYYGPGFINVFINGFCGNINHCDFTGDPPFHQYPEHYKRMGRMLAADVIRIRETAVPMTSDAISGASVTVKIPTRQPDADLIELAQSYLALDKKDTNDVERFYAREAEYRREKGVEKIEAFLQVLVIGELAVFGSPAETYVEFALMLKKQSPFLYNMTSNLANGCVGYIPIRELFRPGIYEARLCSSSNLSPDAGYIFTENLLGLAKGLYS